MRKTHGQNNRKSVQERYCTVDTKRSGTCFLSLISQICRDLLMEENKQFIKNLVNIDILMFPHKM